VLAFNPRRVYRLYSKQDILDDDICGRATSLCGRMTGLSALPRRTYPADVPRSARLQPLPFATPTTPAACRTLCAPRVNCGRCCDAVQVYAICTAVYIHPPIVHSPMLAGYQLSAVNTTSAMRCRTSSPKIPMAV
jgi:hypothetical protein